MRARLSFVLRNSCAVLGGRSTSCTIGIEQVIDMAMESALLELLDGARDALAPQAKLLCDGPHILDALKAAGVFRVSDLHAVVTSDFDGLKAALHPTPLLFLLNLKKAVLQPPPTASPATPPKTPAGDGFETPGAPPPVTPPPVTSVVVTVKVGPKALITARIITVSATTSFAELRNLAVAEESAAEREQIAALPVKVATYTGPQQLSTQKAEAQLSELVAATISLGYRHVVFCHTAPAQQPAARPSANAFQRMTGASELPDLETCDDGAELSFDKALFNWLVNMCKADGLGVRGDDKKSCAKLLTAVRNALQAIDGREGNFQYSRVPERFKEYKSGDGAIKRAKKPAKSSLDSKVIRGYADTLRGAIDTHAFTRSPLWKAFVGDCDELYAVLALKYNKMREASKAQAERQADPTVKSGKIEPETIEPCEAGTIARYESLESLLLAKDCYEIIELTEEMISSLHPPSDKALKDDSLRKHYQRYRDNIIFHSLAVKKFAATFGSQRKLMLFLWKVPTYRGQRSEADNDRTIQLVSKRLPEIHSRATRQEFNERYSHAVLTKGVLRDMYSLLSSDGSAPLNSRELAVDQRTFEFLAAHGDIELWPDLRVLNSGERDKFNLFWAAAERVLASLISCAADNRHSNARTLMQPLSVPDFSRRVVEQLHLDGHVDAAVPSDKWIGFQFQPRCPTRELATHYTGRWEITLKVLSTTMRKFNVRLCPCLELGKPHPEAGTNSRSLTFSPRQEDAHYCNALELNVKDFLRDADTVLEREFRKVLGAREEREVRGEHGWDELLQGDAHISIDDVKAYLAIAERIVRVSNDDKCKVPTGEPGNPIGANVRAMAAAVVLKAVRLLAMDHSWHRASITPTVTLLTDLSHAFETNKWRNGQVVVSLKDSVLEPSSAFRNAAELATTILSVCAKPIIIDKRTDGGPEQNTTFGSVQLADVALWKTTGADLLIHQRPAADNSWVNDAEGCMALFNLGLQHQATERIKMDPKYEELLANEGSMSAIREKIASIEDESEREAAAAAWLASLHGPGSPIEQIEKRFGRLIYTDRTVKIQAVATAAEIAALHALVKAIDSEWEPEMTTKVALLKLEKLQCFLAKHTIRDKYIVCVFKCGAADCEFNCGPLRMPRTAYDELIGDRLAAKCKIVPHPEHTTASGKEHFDKYPNLKDRPTSEKHMPSFKQPTEASTDAKKADQATAKAAAMKAKASKVELFHAAKARCLIDCSECRKPRVLYSLSSLSPEEKDLAQSTIDEVSSYVCGATKLFNEDHMLASKLFIRSALTCGMPIEKQYYSSKQFRDCCSWCGTTDALELEDLTRLNLNGAKGYSICKQCYAGGEKEDDHQYKVEIILAKKEEKETRKGLVTKWAVKWQGFDTTDQMTWEPAGNLTNVRADVDAFERRLASMPRLDAFSAAAGALACCFGSVCKHSSDAGLAKNPCVVCAKPLHHMCASQHPFLQPFYDKLESDNYCFDCSLLIATMEKRTPFGTTGAQLMFEPYYKQLRGVAALVPSPFGLGALIVTKSLKLVQPSSFVARTVPARAKCGKCKSAEGELRACSFCMFGVFHDTPECLGEQRGPESSLKHQAFPWCCPKCFKKGKTALEKTLLGPPPKKRGR